MTDVLRKMSELDRQIASENEVVRAKGGKVSLVERSRKKTLDEGTHTVLKFSDGTVKRIQRLNSTESMGLAGWHDIDVKEMMSSYIADTEVDAITSLLRKKNQ